MRELEIVDVVSKINIYPDGSRYTGTLKDGERSGFGMMKWKSGATYIGNWLNQIP